MGKHCAPFPAAWETNTGRKRYQEEEEKGMRMKVEKRVDEVINVEWWWDFQLPEHPGVVGIVLTQTHFDFSVLFNNDTAANLLSSTSFLFFFSWLWKHFCISPFSTFLKNWNYEDWSPTNILSSCKGLSLKGAAFKQAVLVWKLEIYKALNWNCENQNKNCMCFFLICALFKILKKCHVDSVFAHHW